jgi:hypothetical protein
VISFATKFQPCEDEACTIMVVLKNEVTVEARKSPMFQRHKLLAVYVVTLDNSAAFKKFAMETIGISSMKCAAHLTGNKHFH